MPNDNHILVLGSGDTSRANVEALLDDYFFNKKDKNVIVLAFKNQASQGQVFAAQFAKDNNYEIVVFANDGFISAGLPPATVSHSKSPVEDALKSAKGSNPVVFMLWSDEDMETANIVKAASDVGFPIFDLTDGLTQVDYSKNIQKVETPDMPKVEATTAKEKHPALFEEEEEDEEEAPLDEYEEVDDEVFALAEALSAFAKLIAKAVVEEMKKDENK
ncbi:hypothetical protein [Brevundimonas sp.]|jgi:hypothetical protein|uniref:hypothetical protein n=1 Tax=Brevundimonas sp. TaxID=1871086 RepID=UPI0037850550